MDIQAEHLDAVPADRPASYYRRKSAAWLDACAGYRRQASRNERFSDALWMAHQSVRMAAANRRRLMQMGGK